jgi:hypothetical protein
MFDDIIVPKSYLRGLLTKRQEKLIIHDNYQTKSLENSLCIYKVYRQKLYMSDKHLPHIFEAVAKGKKKWVFIPHTGAVYFYDTFEDNKGDSYWVEIIFTFVDGVLDTKHLVKFEICRSAQEKQKEDKEWEVRKGKRDLFQKTLKYKIFNFLQDVLFRFGNWAAKQTIAPRNEETEPAKRHLKKHEKARKTAQKKKLPKSKV